eukprot:Skav200593  [mRNA]  locus=scaffold2706:73723:74817:+ [translate_table: standard]
MQPPARSQRIQGVVLTSHESYFEIAPDPHRTARILHQIDSVIKTNQLSADAAAKLAGKLQFTQEAIHGQSIKACMQPLYTHATAGHFNHKHTTLQPATRDALVTLQTLLPKQQPFQATFTSGEVTAIYADAYFKAGEKCLRLTEAADDPTWHADLANQYENGWGFVIRTVHEGTFYACGRVPAELMGMVTTRRAYIYSLEILGQMIAVIAGGNLVTKHFWSYCDNEPGRCAMTRGFGRDVRVNRLLSCMWQYMQLRGFSPAFQRVTSGANIADEVSRHQLQMARALGWKQIQVNWSELYHILADATKNLQNTAEVATRLLHFSLQCWHAKIVDARIRDDMVESRSSNRATALPKGCSRIEVQRV